MSVVALGVQDVVFKEYFTGKLSLDKRQLRTDNSYINIFGPGQDRDMEFLTQHPEIKVLFKGPKAVNGNRYHGVEPRNTIVVYEYEPKVSL